MSVRKPYLLAPHPVCVYLDGERGVSKYSEAPGKPQDKKVVMKRQEGYGLFGYSGVIDS